MLRQSNPIPVFYAVNDQYVPYLTVSVTSLIDHASLQTNYDVYILYQQLKKRNKTSLRQLSTANINVHLISMGSRLASLKNDHNTLRGDYATLTIYYRLFIANMFPEYQRAIYLDADTILNDDVANLYQIDLSGKLIGAVPDAFARRYDDAVKYVHEFLGLTMDSYYNSGVLLLDLRGLRQHQFLETFLKLLDRYHFDVLAADQDYMNVICQRLILTLPTEWNINPPQDGHEELTRPRLVHYAFFDKPWLHQHVPYDEYFWEEAAKTRLLDQLKAQQRKDEKQRQAREGKVVAGLLAHARQLQGTTPSFKSLFQSGKEHPLCLNRAHKPSEIFTMPSNAAISTPKLNQTMLS